MQRRDSSDVDFNVRLRSFIQMQLLSMVVFYSVVTEFDVPTKIRLEPVDVNICLVHFLWRIFWDKDISYRHYV
jgi:hypothetical protein